MHTCNENDLSIRMIVRCNMEQYGKPETIENNNNKNRQQKKCKLTQQETDQ